MRAISRKISGFLSDDSGQGMLEYIMIIGLVVLILIVALYSYRDAVKRFISRVVQFINGDAKDIGSPGSKPPGPGGPSDVPKS